MDFQVDFRGKNIFRWSTPRGQIKYNNPMIEWVLAAHWGNYTWTDFRDLDGEDQSLIVAAYRVYNQIEAVMAWYGRKKTRRK